MINYDPDQGASPGPRRSGNGLAAWPDAEFVVYRIRGSAVHSKLERFNIAVKRYAARAV
jgi:hypothetical protein